MRKKLNIANIAFSMLLLSWLVYPTSSIPINAQISTSNPRPILDAKILNGYYLHKCIDQSQIENNVKILSEKETWMTVAPTELEKAEIWKPDWEKRIRYSIITVERYHLNSNKDALTYANSYMARAGGRLVWSEGSYTGDLIGQKCWSNKNSNTRKESVKEWGYENGLSLIFVNGDMLVRVDGSSLPFANNSSPMRPEFVEDVARAIDSKLK